MFTKQNYTLMGGGRILFAMLILPLIISFNSFGQQREASPVKPGVLAPPIEEPLEPLQPGECTPESEGRDGLWRFRSIQTQTGNNVNYFWLGRNPNEIPLSSFWVGINKSSPASVLDVHYPDNRSASARLGLSVTTGNCNAVGLVAGDRFPGWVGSYVASGEFPYGSPFQIRAGIADGGVWNPSEGTFIHLNPENRAIGVNNNAPNSTLDVRGDVHAESDIKTDQNLHAFQGANVGFGALTSTVPNGLAVAGRVGIGTQTPLSNLQIGNNHIFYTDVANTYMARNWYFDPATGVSQKINNQLAAGQITFNKDGEIVFTNGDKEYDIPRPETIMTNKVKITPKGNVGIGEMEPTSMLHISKTAGPGALVEQRLLSLSNRWNNISGQTVEISQTFDNGEPSPSGWKMNAAVTNNDYFRIGRFSGNSQWEYLRINNQGNVGIGTTSPGEKLEVAGKISAENLKLTSSTLSSDPGILSRNSNGDIVTKTKSEILNDLGISGTQGTTNEANKIAKYDQNGNLGASVGMVEDGTGNVGIGTASPHTTSKLQVKGNLWIEDISSSVASTLRIGNLQPSLGSTHQNAKLFCSGKGVFHSLFVHNPTDWIAWPDFVFAKNYKLPSLKETEEFIEKEQHLPGVPSATEVNEKGVDLLEMNKILL